MEVLAAYLNPADEVAGIRAMLAELRTVRRQRQYLVDRREPEVRDQHLHVACVPTSARQDLHRQQMLRRRS